MRVPVSLDDFKVFVKKFCLQLRTDEGVDESGEGKNADGENADVEDLAGKVEKASLSHKDGRSSSNNNESSVLYRMIEDCVSKSELKTVDFNERELWRLHRRRRALWSTPSTLSRTSRAHT